MKKLLILTIFTVFLVAGPALAQDMEFKDISAQNTFTDAITIEDDGSILVVDTSSMSMTVTLQVKPPHYASWVDIHTQTSEGIYGITNGAGYQWRIGVKTGDYTSGSCRVYIRD